MNTYKQSATLAEVRAKHPFPWREERFGPNVRMIDAGGVEVVLFEITALAMIITATIESQKQAGQSQVNDAKPQG